MFTHHDQLVMMGFFFVAVNTDDHKIGTSSSEKWNLFLIK